MNDIRTLRECLADWTKDRRRPLVLLVGILLLLLIPVLAGCDGPLPMTREPDKTHVVVVVQWATPDQIKTLCNHALSKGCTIGEQMIVAPKPTSWGDEVALLTLGHEFFHVLGARH